MKEKLTHNEKEELKRKYFVNGKLKNFPSKRGRQIIILEIIGDYFETGKKYSEIDINNILKELLDCRDHVTMRRDLIDSGILKRTALGEEYWKEDRK